MTDVLRCWIYWRSARQSTRPALERHCSDPPREFNYRVGPQAESSAHPSAAKQIDASPNRVFQILLGSLLTSLRNWDDKRLSVVWCGEDLLVPFPSRRPLLTGL